VIPMNENRSCREFIEAYKDARVNCKTCSKFDKELGKCAIEKGVVRRYEESHSFEVYDWMMRQNKGVRMG
jgi:hypothetical protein